MKKFLESKNVPKKAVLFKNNARCHSDYESLTEDGTITVLFSPSIATSTGQPMDQKVLESMKNKYRSQLLNFILLNDADDDYTPRLKEIGMLGCAQEPVGNI